MIWSGIGLPNDAHKVFEVHMTRRYPIAVAALLTSILVLPGCGKANEPAYSTPAGWNPVCLDRLLIDVPGAVEMGASEPRSDGAYGFKGIEDVGGKGVRWGKVSILETVSTNAAGYDAVYRGVRPVRVTDAEFRDAAAQHEKEIQRWVERTKSGTPNEIATAQRIVNREKKDLEAERYGFKVSGEAAIPEKYAFAIRLDKEFTLGFLDVADQRVRLFKGELSQPQSESPKAAAEEYGRFRRIYHARPATAVPVAPGYCTGFGFIDERDRAETDSELEMPFRLQKYPNLIFILTLAPASLHTPRDIQGLPRMDADNAKLDLIGVKGSYGPIKETILGTPGRSYGQEYGPNCSPTSCRPADQAYDIEAETFGVPGRVDQPHLILHMTAATSDDYKLKRPFIPNEPSYNKPDRPALSGHVPPPFKDGQRIFEQVLRSIRLRPGAIAQPSSSAGDSAAAPQRTR